MDTDLYKAQARRLGDHLADKHGVKLGHAALLEAIAAAHGTRSWNVLASQGAEASLVARVVQGAKGMLGAGRVVADAAWAPGQLIIGRTWDSQQPVVLDGDSFSRHLLVIGPKAEDLLTACICHQAQGAGGSLVIDAGSPRGSFSASMTLHYLKKVPRRAQPEDTPADWLEGRKVAFENLRLYTPERARECAIRLLGQLIEEASRRPNHAPFQVAIRGAGNIMCPELVRLVQQGRSIGISCVLAVERMSALARTVDDHELAEAVLRNTATKVILRQADEGADREVDDRYHLPQVRKLSDSEALFLDGQEPTMFRLAKLPR